MSFMGQIRQQFPSIQITEQLILLETTTIFYLLQNLLQNLHHASVQDKFNLTLPGHLSDTILGHTTGHL